MDEANMNSQESAPERNYNTTHQQDDDGCSEEANLPDRLSELPESLLVQIVSLLPIEDAVRTGVLSTRWKNLWNHVDKLVFMYDTYEPSSLTNFISSVDRTLMQCDSPKIQKFSLLAYLYYEDFDHEVLDRWLQWVYSRNVECIKVEIPRFNYTTPEWFYHNPSLVKLSIYDFNIRILGHVSWTSLKSLTLSYAAVEDDQIAKILSGCPVLENLVLFEVTNCNRLYIMSTSLVELTVVNFEEIAIEGLLEINAPSLKFLNLSGYFYGVIIRLIDVSSLVHANINIRHSSNPLAEGNADDLLLNAATELLQSVHHVEELTFGTELIQVLSIMKLLGKPCPLFKCKRLTVCLPIMKYELPGMIYLLKSSPHLQTLVIDAEIHMKDDLHQYLNSICGFDGAEYLSTESGDLMHLRNIEVAYSRFTCSQYEAQIGNKEYFDFELIAYVLRNARVLEKWVIGSQQEMCPCSRNCVLQHVSLMSHKLLQWKAEKLVNGN